MKDVDFSALFEIEFPQLKNMGSQKLLAPVTKDEVYLALRGMPSFNSPEVDSF